jgi:hydroxymethylpyrimidine/phosphomethylpyrimidine kinase
VKKVLTIAGSDCSGGAGIQADIKTITVHKMYAMSVITALTAQNTTGVYGITEAKAEFVGQQIDCIFNDIRPDSVKIGMVSGSNIIEAIVDRLGHHRAKNIVVDPVMVSTSGSKLLSAEAMDAVITKLIPIADIITPNIPEAQAICNISISNTDDMERAAEKMSKMLKGAVLIKGGHLTDTADDLLYANGRILWIRGERVNNPNNHGTGCTLSSAIACNLAQGLDIEISVRNAKNYITGALKSNLNLGRGRGPLNHVWEL